MQKNYSGSIALTKLQSAIVELKGKSGKVKGVFIPIEQNHLVAGKENAYYLPVRIITKDETDQYGQNGFISQTVDSKKYKEATNEQKEEFKNLPILGNIKDFSGGGNDSSGVAEGTFEETDDLPF